MADFDRLQQDLGFVRGAVARATPRSPVPTYFLTSIAYAWSIIGVLLSGACAAAGVRESRSRVVA